MKSKDTNVQLKTVRELYAFLLNELKKIKREEETGFILSLITLIKKLSDERNDNIADKQASILIITSIINLDNINVRVSKIHQAPLFIQLRNLLSCTDTMIIQMASRAIGRLVMAGVECDQEFKIALESLRNETKRYTGIICVREIALASQSRLFLNSAMFFQDIIMAITDKNSNIRQEACELFRLSLHIIISREVSVIRMDNNMRGVSVRRSSTASSLTNSQDSLHSSIASSNIIPTNSASVNSQQQHQQQIPNDYFFTLQYKCCFENALKELEICLYNSNSNKKDVSTKVANREEKIHGYLLIINEILKFTSLEFEKEIEKNLAAYITHTIEAENQIKTCEELHAKNLLTLLPYSFEPVNDPFLFLFKSEKINIKVQSKNCHNFIHEKYDHLFSCLSRLYLSNNIYIQQVLLQLIPRLANFDRVKFTQLYLNSVIEYLLSLMSKKLSFMKPEALFSTGLLSIAVGAQFYRHAKFFIDIIRSNNLFNAKENEKQKKRGTGSLSSSASLASIVSSASLMHSSVHHNQTINALSSALNTSSNSFIASSNTQISNTFTSLTSKYSFYNVNSNQNNNNNNANGSVLLNISASDDLNSILACVSMFAKSMPIEMADSILELLEPLMLTSGGVTHTMRYCLDEISRWIPQLRPAIHENLLKIISQILTGKPLCQIIQTVSTSLSKNQQPQFGKSVSLANINSIEMENNNKLSTQSSLSNADDVLIVQALQSLRSFEFTTVYVIAFLRYCIDYYLNNESSKVKIETVLTACVLLNRIIKTIEHQDSRSLISLVSSSLRKLLDCALTDSDANVRYYILNSINLPQFNMFIALPENLNILFLCVRDEKVEIRELSASIISRLSVSSSAYILPFIRKILMQLLIEIEIYPDVLQKELTVRLIGHLLSATPRLVNLYAKPLLDNLHNKLVEYQNDVRFASSIVTIVGQLASQSGPETLFHFDTIIPFLIESMQDFYYIQLKHTSLWTLGQIISNTGYVIEPYKKYPTLLKILLSFLQSETSIPVRRETMRILGLIGAIDPFEYKRNLVGNSGGTNGLGTDYGCDTKYTIASTATDSSKVISLDPNEILTTINVNSSLDEYYPALAIHLLMKIIKDAIGIGPRKDAIQALFYAMRTLDNRCVNYIELVVPPFLELIKNVNDNLLIDLITQLGLLITFIKKHIEPYLPSIINVVEYYWNISEKPNLLVTLIDLLQNIVNVMDVEFKKYLPQVIPLILKQLQSNINNNNNSNVQKLLHLLRSCSACMEFYVHLILSQFSDYLTNSSVKQEIKQDLMYTIYTFAKNITLTDNCATLFQSFIKILNQYLPMVTTAPPLSAPNNNQASNGNFKLPASLRNEKLTAQTDIILLVLETLYLIAKQMGPSKFSIYVPMFDKILLKNKHYSKIYEQLTSYCKNDAININICNTRLSPAFVNSLTIGTDHQDAASHDTQSERKNLTQNKSNETLVTLQKQYNFIQNIQFSNLKVRFDKAEHLASRDGWRESFRRFQIAVIEESSVSILRVCCLIAHDSVPPELFNACFISIWTNINEREQNETVRYLELALKNSEVHDIIKTILNLAEFMERCDSPLPIEPKILAEKAFSVRAYAKSLHYVEEQFHNSTQPTSEILEQLVTLNHELQRTEAAAGVLDYGSKHLKNLDMRVKERWYEKLHDWQKALNGYEKELNYEQPALSAASANPTTIQTDPKTLTQTKLELLLGKMRCLKGLGDWNKLKYICKDMLNCVSQLSVIKDDNHEEFSVGISSPFY